MRPRCRTDRLRTVSGHNPSTPCPHVLPTFSMPLDALESRQSAPTEPRRDHPSLPTAFTAPPPLTSPCTASRIFNGEGRLTLGAWTTRRAARGGQRCPPAQTSSDRLRCDHSSTARVTCVPAGPRRSGLQQCQPRVVCATERHATAARFRLSAHRCGPCSGRWSTFSLNREKRKCCGASALPRQHLLS